MKRMAIAILAGLLAASALGVAADDAAPTKPLAEVEAKARQAWREAIEHIAVPGEGCFHTAYPSTEWARVECGAAPKRRYLPRRAATSDTVGDGVDNVAKVAGHMSKSVGTFPVVSGVKSEIELAALEVNGYTLQLNSNFMTNAACNGIAKCQSWEQFVYSSGEESAFMQYWLINYGTCPSGWISDKPDCYMNSAAVTVPKIPVTDLAKLKLSAQALFGGIDTLIFTNDTQAYSTTGKDSVVDLATDWSESEFNIIGDGGGSEARFNSGSSITVHIAVYDGTSTAAPACVADGGTTGETNNLKLGTCTTGGGSAPFIEFVESN